MASRVEIEVVAVDKASKAFGDISKGILEMGGGASKLGLAFSIAATAVAAFSKAFEYGKMAAGNERLMDSGEQLAASYGQSMDTIISKVREASLGTVSDMDIIASANKAMMLGVGGNAEQLANLMEIAALRGRAMGISTSQAFDDMARGIGRMSPMILDNLGIILDAKKTYGDYAESIGKSSNELTRAEKIQALLNKVIEEGNKQLAATGGLIKDNASAYEKFGAELTNTKNYLIATTSEMARFADMGGDALITFRELADNGLGYGGDKLNAWSLLVGVAEKRVALMNSEIENQNSLISNSTNGYIAMAESLSGVTYGLEDTDEAMKLMSTTNMGLLSSVKTIQAATDSYEASLSTLTTETGMLERQQAAMGTRTAANAAEWDALSQKMWENNLAASQLARDNELAMKKIAADLYIAKLSVDGLTDAEYKLAIQALITSGQIDQATADMAMNFEQNLKPEVIKTKDEVRTLGNLAKSLATDYFMNFVASLSVNYSGSGGGGANPALYSSVEDNSDSPYTAPTEDYVPGPTQGFAGMSGGGKGGGSTSGGAVVINYSPVLSTMSRDEMQNILLPFIIEGIRQANLR